MKSVATLADVRRQAMAQGATVSVGGDKFNASRGVAMLPRPAAKPEPPAPDQMEPVVRAIAAMSAAQYESTRMLAAALADGMKALAPTPVVEPAKPTPAREFTAVVSRDASGAITHVATALVNSPESPVRLYTVLRDAQGRVSEITSALAPS